MNTELANHALQTWERNPIRRNSIRFALYGKDGQYHGSFPDESSAHSYVDEVASTSAWIGERYQVIKFR